MLATSRLQVRLLLFVLPLLSLPSLVSAGELHDAIVANDLARVKSAIAKGADVNELGLYGPPLYYAAIRGSPEAATILLDAGADIEGANPESNGAHALHAAALGNSASIVVLLIKRGANVESKDSRGRTPLIVAASNGSAEALAALLDGGANPANIDDRDKETALHYAASAGNVAIAKLLLAHKADINARSGTTQDTPLHWAAMDSRADMVRFLATQGADLAVKDKEGKTPYGMAPNPEIQQILQTFGAK